MEEADKDVEYWYDVRDAGFQLRLKGDDKYDKVEIPDCYNCKTYSNNMKELVHCPHCGDEIEIGDSYTSLEYHTGMGFGYAVCEPCYELEWERRKKYKGE